MTEARELKGRALAAETAKAVQQTAEMFKADAAIKRSDAIREAWFWQELCDLASKNGRSVDEEIVLALDHWVRASRNKKGGAPA